MPERLGRQTQGSATLPALLFLLSLLAGVLVPGPALSVDWDANEPSRTTAGDLDDHEASAGDLSDHAAESHEMDEGRSGDLDDRVVGREDMDVVETEELADHEGSSTDLQDLRMEAPEDGYDEIDDGRLDGIEDASLNARQLVAKRRLESAQASADAARTRYGDMIRDDYPRGAARIRIIEERDATMADLKQARAEFDAAMGN